MTQSDVSLAVAIAIPERTVDLHLRQFDDS